MRLNPARQWFGPKRYGWGFSPRTWEGWVVLLLLGVVLVGGCSLFLA